MVLGLAVALLAADFLWFVHQMPATEVAPARNADGIVALTGGPFRINDALDLPWPPAAASAFSSAASIRRRVRVKSRG